MTARERAIKLQKSKDLAHVIYGYIDKMQAEIDGLEMILAVHQR